MKVFGIGFHKTGTTTLEVALRELGYDVCRVKDGLGLTQDLVSGNLDPLFKLADKYDAFQDNPWPLVYRELDEKYPNSKFILTIRDEQSWMNSLINHFGSQETEMRKWIYGIGFPKGNENIYLDRYRKHNDEVSNYFADRNNDLIKISWERGDGWDRLCDFLGKPIPQKPFPHANKGSYDNKNKNNTPSQTLKSKLFKLMKSI